MPRSKRNSGAAKQKKAIQSRLTEINIMIDFYIHKGIPIPVEEKAGCLDEIAGFKTICMGDALALQVIEKTYRCIKSALNEEESSSQMDVPFQSTNINQSPVNSLTDVDITKDIHNIPTSAQVISKTVFNIPKATQNLPKTTHNIPKAAQNIPKVAQNVTQVAQNVTNSTQDTAVATQNITKTAQNIPNATQNIPKASQNNQKHSQNTSKYAQIIPKATLKLNERTTNITIDENAIDLCENEDVITNNQQYIDVYMNTALSDLSLKETVPINVDYESSQSILENFTQDNTTAIPEITHGKNGNDACKEIQVFKKPIGPEQCFKTQIEHPRKELYIVNVHDKENSNPKTAEISGSNLKKTRKRKTKISDYLVGSNPKNLRKKTTSTDKRNLQKAANPNKINEKITKPTKRTTKRKPKNVEVGKIVTQDIRSFFAAQNNNEIKTLDKSVDPEPETKSATVKNTVIVEKPSIYTEKVLGDLSWMENLRFVREIAADEFDPNLGDLEDSFWDNFSLPFSDDQDFAVY